MIYCFLLSHSTTFNYETIIHLLNPSYWCFYEIFSHACSDHLKMGGEGGGIVSTMKATSTFFLMINLAYYYFLNIELAFYWLFTIWHWVHTTMQSLSYVVNIWLKCTFGPLFYLKQEFSTLFQNYSFWSPSFTHYCNFGPNLDFLAQKWWFWSSKAIIIFEFSFKIQN
jgi:hypothetical protein